MKKLVSAALALSIAATMAVGLSGCGGNDSANTLVWYQIGDKPDDHDAVMAKANEIIEPALGMKLDMQYIDGASFTEKMKLKMASGDKYDLAFTGYANQYQTAVAMGGLYDITELIKETGLDQVIPDYYLETATIDGKIYGIPNIQVISNPQNIGVLESVANECGVVEELATIQEKSKIGNSYEDMAALMDVYDSMLEKIHTTRPDLYAWNPYHNPASIPIYETLVGGVAIRKDGTSTQLIDYYTTDEWKLGVDKIHEWYEKGYIRSDIASATNSLTSPEERKKVAVTGGTWKPGQEVYEKNQYGEPNISATIHEPFVGRISALLTMISVGANTRHPKEAVELIKLLNTDEELFNLICWGIEDTHYTKNADGTVTEIKDSGYNGIGQNAWKYGNQFMGFVAEGQPADVWEQTEKMNNEAVKSPMLGFVPDTTAIDTEIANLANVDAEYTARKDYGTEDSSVWLEEYLDKRQKAGIEKVCAELQKQYDEWLASK